MTPKRIITTWICDEHHGTYRERDKQRFYKSLESWHRLMPDYDIRIISSGNVFDYGSDPWAEQQRSADNLIGLSDWARLQWLRALGGIYVDMDVEAVARFDSLLDGTFFAGMFGADPFVGTGVLGCPAGHPFVTDLLGAMSRLNMGAYVGNDSGPRLITRLLNERGWRGQPGSVGPSLTVHQPSAFYPYYWNERFTSARVTPETLAVHHWASSWDQHNPATPEWVRA